MFNPGAHRMNTPERVSKCEALTSFTPFYSCERQLSPPIGYVPPSACRAQGAVQFDM